MTAASGTAGRLVLVATPIGNLGDLSERALAAFRDADAIACEDTRRTGGLLHRHGISAKRFIVVNEHTELDRVPDVIRLLAEGSTVAVCSDAGSPGISDPGERLVRAAIDAGFDVTAVPGPAAVVMALGISGLPTGRWVFEGFLPRSGSGRAERLAELAGEPRTIILYEAPHRVARTIDDLAAACGGDRPAVLARELTKLHEEVWRGSLDEARLHLSSRDPLGEYVIVLGGAPAKGPADDDEIRAALRERFDAGLTTKSAVAEVTAALRAPKRTVYDLALGLAAARRDG
ncbi:MAG TPA: 16S rRNA (cytidine(1402)-2'-O)-methyltransferase [Ilumatobacteraceae bacterium]